MIFWPAVALIISTVMAMPAAAQSHSKERVEVSANVGALTGGSKFTESETFTVNAEPETVTAAHGAKTPVAFNAGAAVKVAPQLWVGAQYAAANAKPSVSITAVVPHPLLFNTPRTVQGSLSAAEHDEQNIHVDLMYALPVKVMDVKVMGGPSFFTVKQDFVSAVTVSETYPFDTATFASATTSRSSKSAAGFNAGVDVSRTISLHVGVGALVRYGRGNVKFDQQTVKAGGLEVGGGVRVRF